jgi:hypothetical protein
MGSVGHQPREGPTTVEGGVQVAEVGLGFPHPLELDMDIRSPRLGGEGGPPTSSVVATVKGRVKSGLLRQRADKEPKFGICDPNRGRGGEQRLTVGEGHEGKEAVEGEDRTERGSWDIRDGYLERGAIKLRSFGEADQKDCTPLNKIDIATCEVGTGFPFSFKFRNQVSGSKEGEETHTEGSPAGQVTRGIEVDEGSESDQVRDGEVSFRLKCLQVTANSFEATCQDWEICCCHRDLDSNPNI